MPDPRIRLDETGVAALIGSSRRGDYSLPAEVLEAADAYDRAIGLAEDTAVKEFLLQRRG